MFFWHLFSFFHRVISELRWPIAGKFCTMLGAVFNFYNSGPKFLGSIHKIFMGQKHAKFGPILVDFKVRRQIFPERIKIFKIGELLDR